MLIDTHCHLDRLKLGRYDGELVKALEAARQAGVGGMMCIGISLGNKEDVVRIAETYSDVVASVGVHPLDVEEGLATAGQLVEWAKHDKVVALGETGLDYYYSEDTKTQQQDSFIIHLEASRVSGLPLVVHTRSAKEDTLALIKEHGDPSIAGVLHCFTEDWDMAKRAMDMNYYISISGIVTFKNAEQIRDVVNQMPLDRLLVETDSPYLAPVPYRGKPNEPAYVRQVAEFIAELRGISYEELITITADNYFRLFPKAKTHLAPVGNG
ncbi:TatD family hydrolase [Aurantivibrio plasticivorans]